MKTHFFTAIVCAVAGLVHSAEPESAKLEVHEWGTFTMVSGSDGVPLRWYQPRESLAELPPFVQHNVTVATKAGLGTWRDSSGREIFVAGNGVPLGGDMVRMETPVIYFYPEKPMSVSVDVEFKSGRLTEWFPGHLSNTPTVTTWFGELVPPDNAEAAAQMPKAEGSRGAHYAHAREVPAAWYFHRSTCPPHDFKSQDITNPFEKFIFYRGAGESIPPMQANSLETGRLKLMRFDQHGAPLVAFALQVDGTQARWSRMPDLPARTGGPTTPAPISEVRMTSALQPLAQVTMELGTAMTKELAAAGLSQDEAKAMVATWSDSWFQENGSRAFVLLSRDWVDSVLPLNITPKPQKLTRVFVGRYETFTPEQEQTLLTLLNPLDKAGALPLQQYRDLKLGRFANAALERAKAILVQRADLQFAALQKASGLQGVTAAR